MKIAWRLDPVNGAASIESRHLCSGENVSDHGRDQSWHRLIVATETMAATAPLVRSELQVKMKDFIVREFGAEDF